jgi:hypothetical protein
MIFFEGMDHAINLNLYENTRHFGRLLKAGLYMADFNFHQFFDDKKVKKIFVSSSSRHVTISARRPQATSAKHR